MAFSNRYQAPRGTRAALNTLASGSSLRAGELYLITDEGRLAVGLTATTYQDFAKNSTFTQTVNGLVPAPTTVTGKVLTDAGTWVLPTNTLGPDGDKGDITVGGTGTTLTIDANAVTNDKFRQSAGTSVVGRSGGSTGNVADIQATINSTVLVRSSGGILEFDAVQTAMLANGAVTFAKFQNAPAAGFVGATGAGVYSNRTPGEVTAALSVFTSGAQGVVPASGGGTANFLRADGTWAAPPGGGLSDGDKGDITVGGSGTTLTIDANAVTFSKFVAAPSAGFVGATGAGNYAHRTPTEVTAALDVATVTSKGLVPAPGTATGKFLKDDLTWDTAGGSGGGYTIVSQNTGTTLTQTSGEIVVLSAPTANITLILPTAVGNTAKFTFKKTNTNTFSITLDPNGTQTIDEATTISFASPMEAVTIVSDNANWWIV